MSENSYQLFKEELPSLFENFNQLVEAQKDLPGLDPKTKQLVNIAIQTAHQNLDGVKMHAALARKMGASWEEVKGAVALNLHLSGLGSILNCLPAAKEGFEMDLEF
ncbi:MAG: carboxymuconolactone decarboxylase family protein [Methanobacteriaceae archaeon]|nr:carboxymuconolactone decarboxylase family protein [Methanobacteriaceae archaeon]MDP2836155.1 carboxymuconolactone decarboxylase family protein [Methanobacteriaceae archaeon]MDP3034279.1 carboxymuconolactone decarboxylase family protein [Methanobacteriaceae archaeon]MDP3485995.1 carboxymuconolactone decarboxylase family protein [Methanobacteriaceae archaeon]MDP3624357.1 carboxymuconolactone decarboxylase family protein [Methanobacteriaceae archaeon]